MSDLYSLDAYDFDLPEELIAQQPAAQRDVSRLLLLDRRTGKTRDYRFGDLPALLAPGDLLVLNDTRVFPARLRGTRETGGGLAEILLVQERENGLWEALARPGRRLKPGARIRFGDRLQGEIMDVLPDGRRTIRLEADGPFWEVLEEVGEPPLPPYIRRPEGTSDRDADRYQTVYARERGSVAAPTAGLHFTRELLEQLSRVGVQIARVTLHVGYGTFEPVRVSDLREHSVAAEAYEVPPETAVAVNEAKQRGSRVIAVGTTTTRTLESAADHTGLLHPGSGMATLTITPGYDFRVVDAMITNFHLPKSSLLVLVSTFAGQDYVLSAYRHAVLSGYRFYSYGDAMLII